MKKNTLLVILPVLILLLPVPAQFCAQVHSAGESSQLVSINKFGAKADARFMNDVGEYFSNEQCTIKATDNTEALQKALNSGKPVFIPQGDYLVSGAVKLSGEKVQIVGEGQNKTRLIFTGSKIKKANTNARNETVIINSGFDYKYNSKTAQKIQIKNLSMFYTRDKLGKPKTLLLLGNVNGATLENLKIQVQSFSENDDLGVTNLDLYVACKNVSINLCTFINDTKASYGACIMVRNFTFEERRKGDNKTQYIKIVQNEFQKNSNDEIVTVFSSRGDVENVEVLNNKMRTFGRTPQIILSVYSAKDKYFGKVRNVKFSGNLIEVHDFYSYVFSIGNSSNNTNSTDLIYFQKNRIIVAHLSNSEKRRRIIHQVDPISKPIFVENNLIEYMPDEGNSNVGVSCKNGLIKGNTIKGRLGIAIERGKVENNSMFGCDSGIVDPERANKNVLVNVRNGVKLNRTPATISDNVIVLQENGDKNTGIETTKGISRKSKIQLSNNIVFTDKNGIAFCFFGGNILFKSSNVHVGDGQTTYSGLGASLE